MNRTGVSSRGQRALLIAFALIVLLKLALVVDEEVVSGRYDPLAYAKSTLVGYWFGDPSDRWPFIYPGGFPFFSGLLMHLGIPYRLGIELLYLSSALVFCLAARRATGSGLLALALLLALAFHPWPLQVLRTFQSDPMFLCFTLICLGLLGLALSRDRLRAADPLLWTAGLTLGLWTWLRFEPPLTAVTAVLFAVAYGAKLLAGREPSGPRGGQLALALLPLAGLLATQLLVKSINYLKWDVFAMSTMSAPGFKSLLKELYRIDTGEAIRYAPVTRKSLEAACAESPTLARVADHLLDVRAPAVRAAAAVTDREGEAASWLIWLVAESIWANPDWYAPRAADAAMRSAASELRAAMQEGRLSRRAAFYPVDPNYRLWIPDLPACLRSRWRNLRVMPRWTESDRSLETDPQRTQYFFDRAASRRLLPAVGYQAEITGWALSSNGGLDSVSLYQEDGRLLASAPLWRITSRPWTLQEPPLDPDARVTFRLATQAKAGQSLSLGFWRGTELVVRESLSPYDYFSAAATNSGSGEVVSYGIEDNLRYDTTVEHASLRRAKQFVSGRYPWILGGLALVAALGGMARRRRPGEDSALLLVAFVGVFLAVRVCYYAAVDAMFGWDTPRYVEAVSPVFVAFLLLVCDLAGRLAVRWRRGASRANSA